MEATLITANTIDQGGIAKGGEKMTPEYKKVAAICFMNPEDWKILGKPEKVKVSTEEGSVVLFAKPDERIRKNEIFIPRGIWANLIISSETYNTGTPMYKNMKATLLPTDEPVLEINELINQYYLKK